MSLAPDRVARLLLATSSRAKLAELRSACQGLPCAIVSPEELGLRLPEIEETGQDFAANAGIKAEAVSRLALAAGEDGLWVVADDSGLEVEALGGAPGVRSARLSGVTGADRDRANNERLLAMLAGVPPSRRDARFVCALAAARGGRIEVRVAGTVEGRILDTPRGVAGFGYDPLFEERRSGRTFAEMSTAEKSAAGHRGQAMRRLRDELARRGLP